MLITSGEGCYADMMERVLYNNILASPALDGQHYFYINPLMLRDAKIAFIHGSTFKRGFHSNQRPEWHDCACCPPNVMRLFSSFTHYLATRDANGIQIHHFAPVNIECDLTSGQRVKLNLTTDYPWQGQVKLRVLETGDSQWALSLRIPEWSQRAVVSINGDVVRNLNLAKGYLILERTWQTGDSIDLDLGMEPMCVASNPRIDATRDCLAIQRGPIIYCLEDRDQEINGRLLDVQIDKNHPLLPRWEGDLLDGVMVIDAQANLLIIKSGVDAFIDP
jgi:DUF1680 family protein